MRPSSTSTSTNKFQNIHIGLVNNSSADIPAPLIVEARYDLLAHHGVQIPGRGARNTGALYKFLDAQPLSQRDNLELSRWLEAAGSRDAKLLLAIQKIEPLFVPVLGLMRNGQDKELINLLMDAHDGGLTFGVSVAEGLPESVALVLQGVMKSPQCRITSIDYPCATISRQGQAPTIRAILRDGITDCTTLECVSGYPAVLSLLERGVPEIRLTALTPPLAQTQGELLRVVSLGGVEKLSLKSDLEAAYRWFSEAIVTANAQLPLERSVQKVELSTFSPAIQDDSREGIVAQLFSAKHLREITLPSADWLLLDFPLTPQSIRGSVPHERPLESWQSLQSLRSLELLTFTFAASDRLEYQSKIDLERTIDLLGAVLKRNKQLRLLPTTEAGLAFTNTMTGVVIEPLGEYLGEVFGGTETGRALAEVNTATAAGASKGRDTAMRTYQSNLPK